MSTTRPELPGTWVLRTADSAQRGTPVSSTAPYGLRPDGRSPVALLPAADPATGRLRAADARGLQGSAVGR